MNYILKLFRRKPRNIDPYAYMGATGVSSEYMALYEDTVRVMREYNKRR